MALKGRGGRPDSNRRQLEPQSRALPTELRPPFKKMNYIYLEAKNQACSFSFLSMPRLHYLARSDSSSTISGELGQELKGDLSQLQADAKSLAAEPFSSRIYRLAEQLQEDLESHQQTLLSQPPVGFPLPQAEERRVWLLTSAWQALGQAYARWSFSQLQPEVLAKAITCLRQIVYLHGIYHRRLPEGVWLDLHALFRLAQQAGKKRGLRWRQADTPQAEYFKAQLLGLADPYALLPQELILLDALLEKWVAMVKITADAGPGWCFAEGLDAPAEWQETGDGLRLDLREIEDLLISHKQFASPEGRFESLGVMPKPIALGLLERLERRWFQAPLEPKKETWPEAEWVVGLESIFMRLEGKAVQAISARMEAGRVKVGKAPSASLQVGDLVGVFAGEGDFIGLARVDRIEWSVKTQNLDVQLEAIPGKVFAVGVQPFYRARQPCAYQRGLLLANQKSLELLLAEQPLPESLTVRLLHGNKLYPVRLDRRQNPARRTLNYRCASAVDLVQK